MSQSILLTDGGGEYLRRTSGAMIDHNAAYTLMVWARASSDMSLFYLWSNYASFSAYDAIYSFGSGASALLQLEVAGGTGGDPDDLGSSIALGDWNCFALVRESASSLKVYKRPSGGSWALDAEATASVSSRSAVGTMVLGNFLGLGGGFNFEGQIAYARAWSAALNTTELEDEATSPEAVRTTNLWGDWPFDAADIGADISGNGRDWEVLGTPAPEDGPEDVETGGGGPTVVDGSASLSASATCTATMRGTGNVAATLTGAATLSAAARGMGNGSAALSASATVAAAMQGTGSGAAALTASATLAATMVGVGSMAAALPCTATLAANALGIGQMSAQLPATLALSGSMLATATISSTLAAAGTVAVSMLGIGSGSAQLPCTAILEATMRVGDEMHATLACSASLSASMVAYANMSASLSVSATCAATFAEPAAPPFVRPGPMPRRRELKSWPRWKFGWR